MNGFLSRALDRLVGHMGLEVEPFAVCRVNRGWSLELAPPAEVHLHFVVDGVGKVLARGFEASVSPRTLIVVPAGISHRVEPNHSVQRVGLDQASCGIDRIGLTQYVAGESSEPGILMMCGRIEATHQASGVGIFDSLREPLVVDIDSARVRTLFDAMLDEQRDPQPGGHQMMVLLMKQVLIHLFRALSSTGSPLLWLQALDDPRFARVLETIFESPSSSHTLDSLARTAGMSRSAFSEAFAKAFGRSAVELLKEVRLDRASKLLRSSKLGVKEIASEVGFASRSHFSRAFKQRFGVDPASYRRP